MKKFKVLSLLAMIMALACLVLGGCGKADPVEPAPAPADTSAVAFEGKYIVNADYVKENLGKENVLLIDARGKEVAAKGTIKGAIAVAWQDLANCTNGKAGDEFWGNILPADQLSEKLSKLGISPDKEIIVFAAAQNGWGDDGRIVWELNAAGFPNAKMVDGGYDALAGAGLEIAQGGAEPVPADVKIADFDRTHAIYTEDLTATYDKCKVVDVRADEEYNGETLYGEAKGGHLPSAIHIKYTDLFNDDGTLKSNMDISKMFADAGIMQTDKVVTYCTAGIRSAYMQLILEMCGFEYTMNYDGSYYRWCVVNPVEQTAPAAPVEPAK